MHCTIRCSLNQSDTRLFILLRALETSSSLLQVHVDAHVIRLWRVKKREHAVGTVVHEFNVLEEKLSVFPFQLCPSCTVKYTINFAQCFSLFGDCQIKTELWFSVEIALNQLKCNYLEAIYIFVINHTHYFENKCSSLPLWHVIWYTGYKMKRAFHTAVAIWEDFVPPQCHNNLISSHLLGEISFLISLSLDAKQIAWHESLLELWRRLGNPNAFEISHAICAIWWLRLVKIMVIVIVINQLYLWFLWLVTASASNPTTTSCISTMGQTAPLIWLAASKTVNYRRRLRALPTSCTWLFVAMALWATLASIWNTKVQ